MKIFKQKKKTVIEPMKTVKVGTHLPFNEMGNKQLPALYIHKSN